MAHSPAAVLSDVDGTLHRSTDLLRECAAGRPAGRAGNGAELLDGFDASPPGQLLR